MESVILSLYEIESSDWLTVLLQKTERHFHNYMHVSVMLYMNENHMFPCCILYQNNVSDERTQHVVLLQM